MSDDELIKLSTKPLYTGIKQLFYMIYTCCMTKVTSNKSALLKQQSFENVVQIECQTTQPKANDKITNVNETQQSTILSAAWPPAYSCLFSCRGRQTVSFFFVNQINSYLASPAQIKYI